MILADSFCQSEKARNSEFSTNLSDTPLIVQFAAKTTYDFVGAAELVYRYSDGVDLNCGCPQRWAIKDGYGCALLNEPEIIHDLVRSFKNRLPNDFSVSVKIRLLNNVNSTIEMCRRLENCGVTFLTVHGRKIWQKNSEPVDFSSLRDIKDSIKIPLIANGGVKSLDNANEMYDRVKCDGVMAAQGLLTNPAMFMNENYTPITCIQDWIDICHSQKKPVTFQCFHHHLVFMMEKILKKKQKQIFNNLSTCSLVYDFLEETFGITPQFLDLDTLGENIDCCYEIIDYLTLQNKFKDKESTLPTETIYNPETRQGKYFMSHISKSCDLDNMDCTLFDEE